MSMQEEKETLLYEVRKKKSRLSFRIGHIIFIHALLPLETTPADHTKQAGGFSPSW